MARGESTGCGSWRSRAFAGAAGSWCSGSGSGCHVGVVERVRLSPFPLAPPGREGREVGGELHAAGEGEGAEAALEVEVADLREAVALVEAERAGAAEEVDAGDAVLA